MQHRNLLLLIALLGIGCAGVQQGVRPSELDLSEPNQLPSGACISRARYPQPVRQAVEEIHGFSGLEFLLGTSREYCLNQNGCRLFSKAEFEALLSRRIPGSSDSALFAIVPCRTAPDFERFIKDEERIAISQSNLDEDTGLQKLVKSMRGEWCGVPQRVAGRTFDFKTELRMVFRREKGLVIGRGTLTWQRTPDGPLGEPGYVDHITLIPQYLSFRDAVFREVSRYRSRRLWRLNKRDSSLEVIRDHIFVMTPSCEGFWKEG